MRTTNEQSLLQDYAGDVFGSASITVAAFVWSSPKVLVVAIAPEDWGRAADGLAHVQGRATDAGFKVIMSAPVGEDA